MLENFIPDIYQKSIFEIDYNKLKKDGIKCIIFDLDNTLVPVSVDKPSKKLKDFIEDLKDMNFRVIIASNSPKRRVAPFKDVLAVDSAYLALKPLKKKYNKILNLYHLKPNHIACVGDQLLTDIWGANKMGFLSILVNPISCTDFAVTKVNRYIENTIYSKLKERELLLKGKYYE